MVTGAGGGAGNMSQPVVSSKEPEGGIKRRFYFCATQLSPFGNMGGNAPTDYNKAIQGIQPLGCGPGVGFEMGFLSYFSSIPLPENVKIGVHVTLLDMGIITTPDDIIIALGPGLGILGTIKLTDDVLADGYLSFAPKYYEGYLSNEYDISDLNRSIFYNKKIGAQIRYKKLLLGTDVEFGSVSGYTDTFPSLPYSIDTRILRLKLGIAF
jgi:hypothetical protein